MTLLYAGIITKNRAEAEAFAARHAHQISDGQRALLALPPAPWEPPFRVVLVDPSFVFPHLRSL